MYPGSINIAHAHADERRNVGLTEARDARQAHLAERANRSSSRAGNLRHRCGVALVSVGQRLQHTPAHSIPDQRGPLGTLHTAR